jgi:hypothetical protein
MRFDAAPGQTHNPGWDPAGTEQALTFATIEAPGYERVVRWVLGTAEHLVENIRLHRIERITAGESVRLTIAPDDTTCFFDAWPGRELICGFVRVVVPSSGTMSVEAIPTQAGSLLPRVEVYSAKGGGQGNPSIIKVFAGTEYHIAVQVPWGSKSQSFIVNTSMAVQ